LCGGDGQGASIFIKQKDGADLGVHHVRGHANDELEYIREAEVIGENLADPVQEVYFFCRRGFALGCH